MHQLNETASSVFYSEMKREVSALRCNIITLRNRLSQHKHENDEFVKSLEALVNVLTQEVENLKTQNSLLNEKINKLCFSLAEWSETECKKREALSFCGSK